MLSFDESLYEKNSMVTIEMKKEAEKTADLIHEDGYSSIHFISVGGSLAIMMPIVEMIKQVSSIPVHLEQAAEFNVTGSNQLDKNSLVIMASKSGTTEDSVKAAKLLKKDGIRIASMVGVMDTELAHLSKWTIHSKATRGIEFQYMLLITLVFRLLNKRGEFPEYERFTNQLDKLPRNLLNIKKQFESTGEKIAEKYAKAPYSLWIGGGEMWGEVYMFTMCVLEEYLWRKCKAVTSAEFFHGTLELVEKDLPVFLLKGEGKTRVLDERVEEFCRKHTDNLVVFDTKEYDLDGIDDEFRWIVAPTITSTILVDRLGRHYEKVTGHTFGDVRYYRKIEY